MTAVKVATSIPADQFTALEAVRQHLGLSRSAAVQEALRLWLAAQESGEAAARYVKGYMAIPEDAGEGEAFVNAWADGMEAEDW
jgi:metal-responsive CopG/Arc/MetJ family transcriptional regulator